MLANYIDERYIRTNVSCKNWQDAIRAGANLLLQEACIEPRYIEAIIRHHMELPYMVIAPGIMLAHARSEEGARAVGLSMITLAEPIAFGSELNDPVKLVITLATTDGKKHMKLLSSLMEFLMKEELVRRLMAAKEVAEAVSIIKS